ncbi:hypothetical protein [Cupriavidus lacunae]|uniref:hypothetical protein n=1 Tax=Cupriavidus lacunae TaxID=2666307 RepID=UPI001058732D|nr:hypothetical protein [Cupriavidus lacunae]
MDDHYQLTAVTVCPRYSQVNNLFEINSLCFAANQLEGVRFPAIAASGVRKPDNGNHARAKRGCVSRSRHEGTGRTIGGRCAGSHA